MQGTWHVRSLLRLLFAAALLCIAWIVLSTSQAHAAERPAPPAVERIGSVARPSPAVNTRTHAATRTVDPVVRPVVRLVPDPVVAPGVTQVADAAGQATDSVAAVSSRLRSTAPVLQERVSRVTTDVVDVVDALPVAGRRPVLIVPRPGVVGLPSVAPPAALPMLSARATEPPTSAVGAQGDAPWFHDGCSSAAKAHGTGTLPRDGQVLVSTGRTTGLPGGPAPWAPGQPSPASSLLPAPSTGAGAAQGDWACPVEDVVLPRGTNLAATAVDWRTPRSHPTHPGTRPD